LTPHEYKNDDYDDGDGDDEDDDHDDGDDRDDCKCGATSGLGRTSLNTLFKDSLLFHSLSSISISSALTSVGAKRCTGVRGVVRGVTALFGFVFFRHGTRTESKARGQMDLYVLRAARAC